VSPTAPAPSGADSYVVRISAVLVRLHAQRPVLASIDRRADVAPGDLEAAAIELEAIGRLLASVKPPASGESTHALLMRACALAARSSRMRQDSVRTNDAALGWNAASAAAGALMMLDRANTDLAASTPK
jgi:hypothetical protein